MLGIQDGRRYLHSDRKARPNLRAPGAAESLGRLTGRYEGGVSVFCRHGDGRRDFGQTASTSTGQYPRPRGLLVRELASDRENTVAQGLVPPNELAAYPPAPLSNGLLAI